MINYKKFAITLWIDGFYKENKQYAYKYATDIKFSVITKSLVYKH